MSDFVKIDKYEITGKLGQGSFGVVYRGHDPFLHRDVAIKVCTVDDANLRRRFQREAEIAGRLAHANIVTAYDHGFEGEIPYLIQEFLDGEDLHEALARGQVFPTLTKLEMLLAIAEGLAYAHQQGVIHRDIKPANIRRLADGRVKILDFGIAKLAHEESQLTQKGVTMGTASYMPPEQVRGGEIDHRADLFSYGVLAYELLCGERPFRGKTISALVYQILYKPPAAMAQLWPECPKELVDLVNRCLEKDPGARFSDFRELIQRLAGIRDQAAQGRWPGMLAPLPPRKRDLDSTLGSDVLSQSLISRTAREVAGRDSSELPTLESVRRSDSAEIPTRDLSEMPTMEARKPQPNAGTKPVPMMVPSGVVTPPPPAPGAAALGAATQRVPMSILPIPPESGAPAPNVTVSTGDAPRLPPNGSIPDPSQPDPVVDFDELATSAHEISKLVAEGHLEAALEQLEETMSRQKGGASGKALTVEPPALDEWKPTTKIDVAGGLPPRPAPAPVSPPSMPPPPSVAAPPSALPPPPPPTFPSEGTFFTTPSDPSPQPPVAFPPVAPGPPTAGPPGGLPPLPPRPSLPGEPPPGVAPLPPGIPVPPTMPPVPVGSSSKTKLLLLAGGAFGLFVVAAIVGYFLLRPSPQPKNTELVPVPTPPPVAEIPAGATRIAVDATPWGKITGIVDGSGKQLPPPSPAVTPLVLVVPGAGNYEVTVVREGTGEVKSCTVTLAAEQLAPCVVAFSDAGAPATDLFKESGWWK